MAIQKYSRCPIIEAVLDIRVDLPSDFPLNSLLKCQQQVVGDYPEKRDAQEVAISGYFSPGGTSTSTHSMPLGFIFQSRDQKRLFQARKDGFTHNRLEPYPGWDVFFSECQRLWEIYRHIAHPRGYTRVALRYINKFTFLTSTVQTDAYFRTYPEISSDLPQLIQNFFFRFELPIPEIASVATVVEAVTAPKPGETAILLDIDLFCSENLPPGNELWSLFGTLREWKNRIFEACITDATREMIL